MHCGFHLNLEGTDEKTILERMESTVLVSFGGLLRKDQNHFQRTPSTEARKVGENPKTPLFCMAGQS